MTSSTDRYISDSELESFQKEFAQKTDSFLEMRRTVLDMYTLFQVKYPYQAENNFRDSWFHYRKIYKERRLSSMIGQTAMFDEHLQRAEKDIVVLFWTEICTYLEFWYNGKFPLDVLKENDVKNGEALDLFETDLLNWVKLFHNKCRSECKQPQESRTAFIGGCIFVFQKCIEPKGKFKEDTQKLIHKIKNNILDIRYGGTDIKRHEEPGIYLDSFDECFRDLMSLCDNYKMHNLICVTDEIIVGLRRLTIAVS